MERVLITGASKGIGKAIADLLKAYDYSVTTLSWSGKNCDHALDLSNGNDLREACNIECDVLINNAGVFDGNFDLTMSVNLKAVYELSKANHKRMEKGTIINIGSSSTNYPMNIKKISQEYMIAKLAMKRYTELLVDERKPGIKISHVNLDYSYTEMTEDWPERLRVKFLQPDDIANTIKYIIESPVNISDITLRSANL